MSSPSPKIPPFRPRRKLFGYERKATDEFVEHVTELLKEADDRIDDAESELAHHREQERSVHEAMLSVARTADTIKQDAHREAGAIRAEARELEQLSAAMRSKLSSFLRETLETLESIHDQVETSYPVAQPEKREPVEASETAEESPRWTRVETNEDDLDRPEEDGSILERLRPYLAETSGDTRLPGS